ncbi:MAG TPA: ABC transporter permease [Gemmatimonadales bacterium]
MGSLFRRLRYYLRRGRYDADMREELSHHQALAARDAEREGLSPEAARLEAVRRVGRAGRITDASRDVWRLARLETVLQDLRYAFRGLRRQPAHAAAAIFTLALGIGATTAIATVLNAVLLTPLPYLEPDRLMQVWEHNIPRDRQRNVVNPGNYLDWRNRNHTFSGMALYVSGEATLVRERPLRLSGTRVTVNMLDILGVRPALGRGFVEEDTEPGRPRALILTDELWRRVFGGDSSIVGQPVALVEGDAFVAGVFPPGFRPLGDEEYWQPVRVPDSARFLGGRFALVIGRLKEGATVEQADADLRAIAQSLQTEYPRTNSGWTVQVEPLMDKVTGGARQVLVMVAGAIGLVLLIACANVASLSVARVIGRQGELGLRAALGATRGRVIRQLAVEGLVVGTLGGALGVLLGLLAVNGLRAAELSEIPRLQEVRLDPRVLGFALLITVLSGLSCGLLPAFSVGGTTPGGTLVGVAGRSTVSRGGGRIRAGLVVLQVALSLLLLAGTGLMVRSLVRLLDVDPGIEYNGVLTSGISLPFRNYQGERVTTFYREIAARVASLPGVQEVGLTTGLPFTSAGGATSFRDADQPEPEPGAMPAADIRAVDPGFFTTLRIPVLRGRGIEDSDLPGGRPVAVVGQALAEQMWPGAEPLGRRLWVSWGSDAGTTVEVVGVVGNARYWGLHNQTRAAIYFPIQQQPGNYMQLAIRVPGNPAATVPLLERELAVLDPNLPLLNPKPYSALVSASIGDRRYPMLLLAILAGLALALSAVGLYGVLAYFVGERTREIGVRRALGATDASVIGLVLGKGGRLVVLGLVLGGLAVLGTTRFLQGLLYEVGTGDPIALGGAIMVLAAVGLAASALPALNAARVDPAITLRGE